MNNFLTGGFDTEIEALGSLEKSEDLAMMHPHSQRSLLGWSCRVTGPFQWDGWLPVGHNPHHSLWPPQH